ncbi:MAG TPA: homoserine O-succinyltransferase [Polyangiaceae bacterium]|nr:homoserine O-succinyltransferase [Polyangiaceae bacterium]
MTIILPQHYHARRALEESRVVCITPEHAVRQDIRPLRIGILNVMPKAETYEYSILLPLGRSIIQIEPVWIRLNTHAYKTSNWEHINNLYVTFDEAIAHAPLDGLILTGAPVEELPFKAVRYWDELTEILATARGHCASTLGICWGGLALAKMIGIEKSNLSRKLFGAFLTRNTERHHPITGDTDDMFWCPQSRHSGIEDAILERQQLLGNVRLLAYEARSGYTIFESIDQRYLMHLGHPEYEPERLLLEYARDRAQGREDVDPPANVNLDYPLNTWRSHRNEFFSQWIKFGYDRSCG